MNSRAAVLTRLRAASCGSLSPGSRGAVTPRSWVTISATIATASSSQATQPMIVIAASATVPSSGLSRPTRSSSQDGMLAGDGVAAEGEEGGRQADQNAGQGEGGEQAEESAAEGGHRSFPWTARTVRDSPVPVTVIWSMPMMPRNLVS